MIEVSVSGAIQIPARASLSRVTSFRPGVVCQTRNIGAQKPMHPECIGCSDRLKMAVDTLKIDTLSCDQLPSPATQAAIGARSAHVICIA